MRDLTEREREVLLAMIDHAIDTTEPERSISIDERARWREQAATVQVSGTCACGYCPTIDLVDEHGNEPDGARINLSAYRGDEGILLFIDGGQLSCLELYSHTDARITQFPHPDELTY